MKTLNGEILHSVENTCDFDTRSYSIWSLRSRHVHRNC